MKTKIRFSDEWKYNNFIPPPGHVPDKWPKQSKPKIKKLSPMKARIEELTIENDGLRQQCKEDGRCTITVTGNNSNDHKWRKLPKINPEKTGPKSPERIYRAFYKEFWERRDRGEERDKIINDIKTKKKLKYYGKVGYLPNEEKLKRVAYSKKYKS